MPKDGVPDEPPVPSWIISYAAELAPSREPGPVVRWLATGSGADVARVGNVVVKIHHPRSDPASLANRLAAIADPPLRNLFVQPLGVSTTPHDDRPVTAWPLVTVLGPSDDLPWSDAGALLARLHRAPVREGLVGHGGRVRLARACATVPQLPGPRADRDLLARLGSQLLREVAGPAERAQRHTASSVAPQGSSLVHGDFHLGQLGWSGFGWQLIDVDDLGAGDPAWDLGRPAGFWAAGLLDDGPWDAFLTAYRAAGGPGVPATGDPWPALDLPARCAVFVAAVRQLRLPVAADSADPAGSLLAACARM